MINKKDFLERMKLTPILIKVALDYSLEGLDMFRSIIAGLFDIRYYLELYITNTFDKRLLMKIL